MPDLENRVPIAPERIVWNKGKLIGAKPPLRPKHVWSIRGDAPADVEKGVAALLALSR
jgi:hypothetical protein